MPQIAGPLQDEGALISVLVGLDRQEVQKRRNQRQPIPQPRDLCALIDTGADLTCLDPRVVQSVGLLWDRFVGANMPGVVGQGVASLYRASVTILHPSGFRRDQFVVPDLVICQLPLRVLGYEALIGRDILDLLRFNYDGPARTFTLAWI